MGNAAVAECFIPPCPSVMLAMQRGGAYHKPPGAGHRAILSGDGMAPAKEEILALLRDLRDAGQVFSSVTVRSVVQAVLEVRAPAVLAENSGPFKISTRWILSFVYKELQWSTRWE
jgi:hypothetical protein